MSTIAADNNQTPKKKTGRGRKTLLPSVKDYCRLCGCSFKVQYGALARQIGTENLFQPSKQKGSTGVVLAKQCDEVGLKVTRSESKLDRVCAACGRKIRNMHQLFCFVASALQDPEMSVSSPERSPVNKKMLRKGIEESASQKRQVEGDDDAEITDNKGKKLTLRKSLFCSTNNEELNQAESNRNGRGDWELGLLNVDDLSQGKTQMKILILYPSEHVKIRTPEDQKTIAITSRANYKQITSRDTFAFSNTYHTHNIGKLSFSHILSEEQQARLDLTGGFSLQTPALFSV